MKKILCAIVAILIFFNFYLSAYGTSINIPENEIETDGKIMLLDTVTDKNLLKKIIKTDRLYVPDGLNLEKKEIFVLKLENSETTNSAINFKRWSGLIYEIKNISVSPKEFYYIDEYDSDWYDGACSIKGEYNKKLSVKAKVKTVIGKGTVKNAIGFSLTQNVSVLNNFHIAVEEGKKVNVRTYANYKSVEFDIYNKFTGRLVEAKAWAAKPIGLVIIRYTYSY